MNSVRSFVQDLNLFREPKLAFASNSGLYTNGHGLRKIVLFFFFFTERDSGRFPIFRRQQGRKIRGKLIKKLMHSWQDPELATLGNIQAYIFVTYELYACFFGGVN